MQSSEFLNKYVADKNFKKSCTDHDLNQLNEDDLREIITILCLQSGPALAELTPDEKLALLERWAMFEDDYILSLMTYIVVDCYEYSPKKIIHLLKKLKCKISDQWRSNYEDALSILSDRGHKITLE